MGKIESMENDKKRRRVFIISREKFPRGSAGANYIQYFALALIEDGYHVIVIGENNTHETKCGKKYKNIEYATYKGYASHVMKSSFDVNEFKKILSYYKADCSDWYIFYSIEITGIKHCLKVLKAKKIYCIRVEDMQPEQYKFGKLNPKYVKYRRALNYIWKYSMGDFAISERLYRQDIKHNCNSTILPIMADPYEYEYDNNHVKGEIVNFIYPGLKPNNLEDDLVLTFNSFANIDAELLKRTVIHITGKTSIESIKKQIKPETFNKIKDHILIHGFMNYEDLILLYKKVDYLLLFRKKNKITEANFPSKIPELLSYGVIPLCTDVGDYTKKYLTDECAFIVDAECISSSVDAIGRAIRLPQSEFFHMRRKARELAEKKFYYKHFQKEISNFLEQNN